MICDQCMKKSSFLQAYLPHSVPNQQICTIKKSDSYENVNIEDIKDETEKPANGVSSTTDIVKGRLENKVFVMCQCYGMFPKNWNRYSKAILYIAL